MLISNKKCIKLYNFDRLTKNYKTIKEEEPSKHFGSMTDKILNEVFIKLEIDKLSIVEFLTLKKITSNIYIKNINIDDYQGLNVTNIDKSIEDLLALRKTILDDNKNIDSSLLPASSISVDVECILSGINILFLCDGVIELLLVKNNGDIRNETEIDDYIVEKLPKLFFNFMRSSLTNNDVISENVEEKLLYDFIPSTINSVTPIRVTGTNDIIQLAGGNNTEVSKALNNIINTSGLESAHIEFGVCSNFYTFFLFNIDTEYVTMYEPLKNLLKNNKLYFDESIYTNYKARIRSVVKKVLEARTSILDDKRMDIIKYYTLLCSDKIKYKLSIPLNSELKCNNIKNDASVKEILMKINKFSSPFTSRLNNNKK